MDASTLESLRVIPYPAPGRWFLSFQVRCARARDGSRQPCPPASSRAMVSVGLHIQPCGYRPVSSLCGDHGVCAKATKGQFR